MTSRRKSELEKGIGSEEERLREREEEEKEEKEIWEKQSKIIKKQMKRLSVTVPAHVPIFTTEDGGVSQFIFKSIYFQPLFISLFCSV